MSNRDNIIRKIKAMQARINDAASSASEVEMALKTVAKWMKEYNLSQTDLDIKNETISSFKATTAASGDRQPAIHYVLKAIEKLTETRLVVVKGDAMWAVGFYGTGPDVQYAEYLFRLSAAAMVQAVQAYHGSPDYNAHCERMDADVVLEAFQIGFVKNLYHRIMELVPPAKEGDGKSLVVIKNALICQETGLPDEDGGQAGALVLSDDTMQATIAGAMESEKVRLRYEANNQTKYLKG